MNNIEIFDSCVAVIFADLYKSFPVPVTLSFQPELNDDNLKSLFTKFLDDSHIETTEGIFRIYEHTVLWLRDSNYIRCRDEFNLGLTDVVLTSKGLELLKMPSSISDDEKLTVGEKLISSFSSGIADTPQTVIKNAISNSFKLMMF